MTEEEVLKKFDEEMQIAADLFKRKNHDYGNSYFTEECNNQERFYNIKRKFIRLKGFYETDKEVKTNETIEDTLRDLGIYCFMEIIRLKNK